MTIKNRVLAAAGLAAVLGLIGAPAIAAKQRTTGTSKQFRAAMSQAQLAARTGDEATYQTGLASATTLAQTPEEKYYIAALQYSRASSLNQRDKARKALGEMLRSGSTLVADPAALNLQAAMMAFEANDNKESLSRFIEADRTGIKDPNALLAYADLHARAKRPADALVLANRALTAATASGQAVPESWYLRAESLAVTAKKPTEMAAWGRLLLAAYPTAANWRTTLLNYADAATLGKEAKLDLYRLARDRAALAGERDITEFAELAIANKAAGEAKIAIDQGVRNSVASSTSPVVKSRLAAVKKAQGAEKKLLTAGSAASASSKAKAEAGQVALAAGENDKAATLLRGALTGATGGDADEINTRLGIALARAGKKAEARQAFAAVTGSRAEIAKFWILHLDTLA